MLSYAEFLIVLALLVGFAIGMWFEHGRRGGTDQLRWQLKCARDELKQRRLAYHGLAAPYVGVARGREGQGGRAVD